VTNRDRNTLRRVETAQGLLLDGMKTLSINMQTQMTQEETSKVLSWLCPLSTNGAQVSLENALNRHLPGTGRWFLDSNLFKAWEAARCSSIWITGLPGSGKTLLCASAIQKVLAKRSKTVAVLYFFCDHGDPSKVSHDSFVMTVMRQLLEQSPELIGNAKKIYDEKANNGERSFKRTDYIPLIQTFMSHFDNVYLLCDALDEASEGEEIATALKQLMSYCIRSEHSIRVLFTSRFDVQLERHHTLITSNRVALADNMKADIEQYVQMEVDHRTEKGSLKLRDQGLRPAIQERVACRAGT
jgi:hypothetical protein